MTKKVFDMGRAMCDVITLKDWTFFIDADNQDVTYNMEKFAEQVRALKIEGVLHDEMVKQQAAQIEKIFGVTPLPPKPKSYRRIRL